MKLEGATALVTGAAKRVGREIALELARGGADIVVHFNSSAGEAEEVAEEIRVLGRRCWKVRADLGDLEELRGMLEQVAREAPPIDVLVNSASIYPATPFESLTIEDWEKNQRVNLRAPFFLSRELGVKMVERGRGKLVNIVDCSIRRPYRGYLPYLVSKGALMTLTEVLALELAPHVQVNAVAPGTVLLPPDASEEQREQSIRRAPLKRLGSPGDIARMVRYLVEEGDWMTGGYYAVDGGAGMR